MSRQYQKMKDKQYQLGYAQGRYDERLETFNKLMKTSKKKKTPIKRRIR